MAMVLLISAIDQKPGVLKVLEPILNPLMQRC